MVDCHRKSELTQISLSQILVLAAILGSTVASYLYKSTSYAPADLYRNYYRPVQYFSGHSSPRVYSKYPTTYSHRWPTTSYSKPYYKVHKEVSYVKKPVVSVKYVKEPVVSYRVRPVKTVSYVKEPVVTYRKTKVVPAYW